MSMLERELCYLCSAACMQRHDLHELVKGFRMTFTPLLCKLLVGMFSPLGYWEIACSSRQIILFSGTESHALNFWQLFTLSPSTDNTVT